MSAANDNRFVTFARTLFATLSLIAISGFIISAVIRLVYPYELEWMEGGILLHIQRVMDGLPLYVQPSLDFTPYIYPPLYYYVCAGFAVVLGNSFFTARIVSLLATLGCFTLIYLIVYKRTRDITTSLAAVGLYACTYRLSGYWFEIARVDSLFLFFLLCGLYTFISNRSSVRNYLTPLFFTLAFLTKQTAIIGIGGIAIATFLNRRGFERIRITLVSVALVILITVWMNQQTDGWFFYYVFQVPDNHLFISPVLIAFWTLFLTAAAVFCILPFVYPIEKFNRHLIKKIPWELVALIFMGYVSKLHWGGYRNVLMPAYAALAISFGFGFHEFFRSRIRKNWGYVLIAVCTLFQLSQLGYYHWQAIPSTASKRQGEQLLQTISQYRGPVFFPSQPWFLFQTKHETQAQEMAIYDVISNDESNRVNERIEKDFLNRVENRYYEAIITNDSTFLLKPEHFYSYYQLVDSNVCNNDFLPTSGAKVKPSYLFIRNSVAN